MKSIDEIEVNLKNKIVLVRLDLNVPIKDGVINDSHRIDKIIPTLEFLRKKKSKIVIISHIGRPDGKFTNELSLKPVAENLSNQLNEEIDLNDKNIFELSKENLFSSAQSQITILENIRFYKEEEINDDIFAKQLASLGDLYVNEAFSCSHRNHASVSKIAEHINSYSGLLLKKEISALEKITYKIENPTTCIIGGSKISTKINIIKNLIPKFNSIIIVGGMANNFLKDNGQNIGKSIFEKNVGEIVYKIRDLAIKKNCKLVFPIDFGVGKSVDGGCLYKKINQIEDDDIILDIGFETMALIEQIIKSSKTILWNGPAGYFENQNFAVGSYKIAEAISNSTKEGKLYSVVGGGDTVAVINKLKLFESYNFVSTAGGAFLEFLEGKELPGIKALN